MGQNNVSALGKFLAVMLALVWPTGVDAKLVKSDHGGMRLNEDLAIADGKSTADPVILLVHGTGAHHRMETIAGVQQALVQQGFNVLAVTLSLGVSGRQAMMSCDKTQDHGLTNAFGEIDAWLGYLGQSGAQRIFLMGHSRDGNQIAWYATLLDAINLPVLMIAASDDTVVPDLAGRVQQIALDNVTVSMVDGVDHFFLDLFADDVADAVHAFAEGGE